MDLPLLSWLETYTFPCESKFADLSFALNVYEKSIKRHLKSGTTFASYFATLHKESSKLLVDVINRVGQRAFVGKVSMDRNAPSFYIEDTDGGCREAEEFARYVLSMTPVGKQFLESIDTKSNSLSSESPLSVASLNLGEVECEKTLLNTLDTPLVMPVVTPRFVPTCTEDMMKFLGKISLRYGLPVQSHMSESMGEIEWVKSLHPEHGTYAEVYKACNLLHNKAYMAHCCHSSQEEIDVMKSTGAGVVHCASSNFNLGSGVMDVRRFIAEGIPVALGTDVAGGK